MRQSISLLALCCWSVCFYAVRAQVPYPGSCPKVKLLEEFDLDAYTGIWFEYAKYPFIFEIGKKCIYARYDNLGNNTVGVLNAAISRFTNSNSTIKGRATVVGPGQLTVFFNSQPSNAEHANYIVLGTDYTSYALVYSCISLPAIAHTRVVWILTRSRQPSEEAVAAAKQVMTDNNLSQTFLMDTLQEGCPPPINGSAAASDDQATSETTESEATSSSSSSPSSPSSSAELQLDGNTATNIIEQA